MVASNVSIRLVKLLDQMAEQDLPAMLVTHMPNVFYLSGFTGSSAALVVTPEDPYILVDPRYTIQAKSECGAARVTEFSGKSSTTAAAELILDLNPKVLGFEADHLTVSRHDEIRGILGDSVETRSTRGVVERLRRVKDKREIALIRRAAGIADAAFAAVIGGIKPNLAERDLALMIDSTMRKLGADKEAFDTIVAWGPNAACPHATPTDAAIRAGGLLKMDFGARYRMYNSDITRTVCVGRATEKHREVYQVVLDAQLRTIEAIAPGKTGSEIDAVARDYITSQGYGESFGHGLGHALGIEVHDGPGFSKTSDVVLEPGMVMTVEPGIYIEGWGGVRIEDDVLVTGTGVEVLTDAPKEFVCL